MQTNYLFIYLLYRKLARCLVETRGVRRIHVGDLLNVKLVGVKRSDLKLKAALHDAYTKFIHPPLVTACFSDIILTVCFLLYCVYVVNNQATMI